MPMASMEKSCIAPCPMSLTALYNTTAIRGTLNAAGDVYKKLKSRKAFYNWYLMEGMEESEFDEALEKYEVLMDDYDTVNCRTTVSSLIRLITKILTISLQNACKWYCGG